MKTHNFTHTLLLLMIISSVVALTGCSSKKDGSSAPTETVPMELNLSDVCQKLLDGNVFKDTLSEVDSSYSQMLMNISADEYTTAIIYTGSGATAERLAVFEAADSSFAQALKDKCTTHVTEQAEAYAGYLPEEVDKLNHAIIKVYDKYVILCVAQDYDKALEIISEDFQ